MLHPRGLGFGLHGICDIYDMKKALVVLCIFSVCCSFKTLKLFSNKADDFYSIVGLTDVVSFVKCGL